VLSNVLNPAANGRGRRRHRVSLLSTYAKLSLAALIAFVVAVSLLSKIIPSPAIPANVVFVGPKYEYYKAHKDEYNALFFGSSRVYSHVIPDVFDAEVSGTSSDLLADKVLADRLKVNSYNFGIPAMRAIDSAVLIEEVLADPPKDLKWVFFESILDKGYEPIPNARTQRAMYWHTWENTRLAAQYILTSDESLTSKAVLLSSHLLPFLYQQMNVGRLFNQVLPSRLSAEELAVTAEFTANEGYYGLTDPADPQRLDFLQNQSAYAEQVATLKAVQATPLADDPYLSANKQMLLARVSQTIRNAGAEPIFLEPPSLHPVNDFQAAQKLGTIDKLLSYKDPNRFPRLYSPEQRHDADHLNAAGSEEFTRLVAKDFVAIPLEGFAIAP
jgi:hypothetical protein